MAARDLGTPLLQVRDLSVEFSTPHGVVRAVDGVNFEVGRGERIAVVGESGSGKSVTALAILGLVPEPAGRVTSGEIEFDGRNLRALRPRQLRALRGTRIAMVFQDAMTSLNPLLSIERQLTEPLEFHLGMTGAQARARAVELLDRVQIPRAAETVKMHPHELSGGMRQRVMIAAALACDPDLLLADEPTTALDVTVQADILALLHDLSEELGTSVVFVTHDLACVAEFAERVVVMYAGRVAEIGDAIDIFQGAGHPYTQDLLASIPRVDVERLPRLPAIGGQLPSSNTPRDMCLYADRCRHTMAQCREKNPPGFATASGHAHCWLLDEEVDAPEESG